MPFEIIRQDITKLKVDAIVNAANEKLSYGGGVCGAIFNAAGVKPLQEACDKIGHCATGSAVITKGFNLPAKYIIHTVGPIYINGNSNEADNLYSAYKASLELAKQNGLKSIAFPLISSGIYAYPKAEAMKIALKAISEYLENEEMNIFLCIFDKESYTISTALYENVKSFISENYVDTHFYKRTRIEKHLDPVAVCMNEEADFLMEEKVTYASRSLNDLIDQLGETFTQALLRLIDEKDYKDVEVYKRANMDRKLFSKIRSDENYQPAKKTALALAIALRLNYDETVDFIAKAGYTLSHAYKSDIIIEYFIKNENYDIYEINETLFAFNEKLLCG